MTVWFWIAAALAGCFGLGALLGAPFLPVRKGDLEDILDLADVKRGQTVIDLGSGDGRLLRAAAKRGAKAIGYEINPLLYVWSVLRTWRYRKTVSIRLGDYWHQRLPEADIIYVFLIERFTNRLDQKLRAELTSPTLVVSYVFRLPRRPIRHNRNTLVYRYP